MIPLTRVLEISASKGNDNAVIFEDKRITWRELSELIPPLISSFKELIILENKQKICFISPNRWELIIAAAAASSIKIPFVGLDFSKSQENLEFMLKCANCGLLIISSNYCNEEKLNIRALASGRKVIDLDNSYHLAMKFNDVFSDTGYDNRQKIETPFRAISFTSGTSGVPKALLRYQSFDSRRFNYFTTRYGFNSQDRHLVAIPLYHAAGNGWARLFMSLGGTLIIAPYGDMEKIAKLIKEEWITTAAITPSLLNGVCEFFEQSGYCPRPNSLKFVLVGGKHFSSFVKLRAINLLGPVIYEYYGTTETGVNTVAEPTDIITHPESVGKAYDGNDIKIIDPNNKPIPYGHTGRIAIASYMNNYMDIDAPRVEIDEKRYLITAETGYLDEDNRLYLMNRSDRKLNFDQYAVENSINKIKGIRDSALININENTHEVDCILSISNETGLETKNEIETCLKRTLAERRLKLKCLCFVNKIPYSPSGKIRIKELEDMVEYKKFNPTVSKKDKLLQCGILHKSSSFLVGILCLLITAMSWGAMFPITKNALTMMDAAHITLFRYGIASFILLGLLAYSEGWRSLDFAGHGLKLFGLGSLGFCGCGILAFAGLKFIKPEHGAIIMALMPLLSALMMWILKGQKIKTITSICIGLALLGVILVVTGGNFAGITSLNVLPALVVLAGAFCWVVYTMGASYVPSFSPLKYTALSCFLSLISIVFVTFISIELGYIETPTMEVIWNVKYALLYLITFAGVLAVLFWNKGIKILGPVNGILFINLVPVTAFLIGYFQGKTFDTAEILGATIVIFTLVLNNINARGWLKLNKKPEIQYYNR